MKTKKLLFFLCLLLISSVSIFAQNQKQKTGSLLWKISGKELNKPSYILGTFHLKPKAYLDSIPGAVTALNSCEQAVGELVMEDLTAMGMKMMQEAKMGSDTTYKMLYTEAEYQLVDSKLKSYMGGAGLDQLGTMKPVMLNFLITIMEYQKMIPNFNPNEGLDQYIQTKAKESGKPALGLETVDDQIFALFGTISLKQQAQNLLCSLQNEESNKLKVMELISIYDHADLTRMQKLMNDDQDPCPYTQQEEDALLKDRNDKWIKQLPSIMKAKSSFIAVGALHLVGEVGLLNQLEKLGYKVEPVRK